MSNNPPFRTVDLTEEQYNFLVDNCDTNIMFGLNAISEPSISRDAAVKIVDLMEQFKSIKKALEQST